MKTEMIHNKRNEISNPRTVRSKPELPIWIVSFAGYYAEVSRGTGQG
jgi:hypothetical protein